jgi:hypothetical protein
MPKEEIIDMVLKMYNARKEALGKSPLSAIQSAKIAL